jgi:hypothetical protein
MRSRKRLKLAPNFADILARSELGIAEVAREADVSTATIFHLLNPNSHPERKGGMQRKTAWKLANAFARLTRREPQTAYEMLIIEEPLLPTTDES